MHQEQIYFAYRTITLYGESFQTLLLYICRWPRSTESISPATPTINCRFSLFRSRSPLLTESHLIYFPPGTKMFQFPGLAAMPYFIQTWIIALWQLGCPIRKSPDQNLFNSSPKLIAVYYVLHRSLQSRHPHNTLSNLQYVS